MGQDSKQLFEFIQTEYIESIRDASKELFRKRDDLQNAGDQLGQEAKDVANFAKAAVKVPYRIKRKLSQVGAKRRRLKMDKYQKKVDKLDSRAKLGSMKSKYKIKKSGAKKDYRVQKANQRHNRYVSRVNMRGI